MHKTMLSHLSKNNCEKRTSGFGDTSRGFGATSGFRLGLVPLVDP